MWTKDSSIQKPALLAPDTVTKALSRTEPVLGPKIATLQALFRLKNSK